MKIQQELDEIKQRLKKTEDQVVTVIEIVKVMDSKIKTIVPSTTYKEKNEWYEG